MILTTMSLKMNPRKKTNFLFIFNFIFNMNVLTSALKWGIVLWLFGYLLGFAFFFIVPPDLLGWVITPFGIAATLFVLFRKMKLDLIKQYYVVAAVWTVLAIVLDYIFIVVMLNAPDYYKLDVYFYYMMTFVLPLAVGYWKMKR